MPATSDIFFFEGEGGWGVNSRCLVQVYVARKIECAALFIIKKNVRPPSPPPLIQGRLTHDRSSFSVSVMNLLYSETSSHVKLRNEMSM